MLADLDEVKPRVNIEELWPKNTLRQMQIRLHDGTMDHDGCQPRVQFMDSVPQRRRLACSAWIIPRSCFEISRVSHVPWPDIFVEVFVW